MKTINPEGLSVIILAGEFAGQEGVCLGKAPEPGKWAVSPDGSDRVVYLEFETEFGILINKGQRPGRN
ncbi:MAG: hypothetical protein IT577_15180 [Verrucomicrobiae bacterium]|nr:hypothetical protein [Verrucomicrobiae bacterium]